jgi:hypothetical protein
MSILNRIKGAVFPKTAAHEVGHALVASHVGLKVHKVELLHGGRSGFTQISGASDIERELQVIVAGFVAEELANGNSGLLGFNKGQYASDLQAATELVGPNLLAIQAAIKADAEYLTRSDIVQYSQYLVNVLEKTGKVDGALIKAP